jgi:hypothetical protein
VVNGAGETFVLSRAVDILAMTDFDDLNDQYVAFDCIQNSVLALSKPVPLTTG